MDFELSEPELAFQAELEAFLAQNASPDVMDENPEQLSQTVDTQAKRAFMRKLAERGWLGMCWPKQYGGQELSGIYDFILTEALSRWGAPQAGKGVGIVGKTIIRHGSEKMKRFFLPKIINAEVEFAIGYSEPNAGSDAASMQLQAERDDEREGWVLNGHKIWTTSAHFADWYWVGARTDPASKHPVSKHRLSKHPLSKHRLSKHKGITLFLIEMDHPGLEIHATWTIGDERTNEVFFNDVFVHDDFIVGELNSGWTYICEALDLERFSMMPVGPVEMKLRALVEHVAKAQIDGEPLHKDPNVRKCIAHLSAEFEIARVLQLRVVSEAVKNRVPTTEASMYKLFMTQFGQRVADAALDMLGPSAQLRPGVAEAPVGGRFERSYRYTVVDTIGGGTSEIQKNIISRRGLGLPKNF